VLIPFIKESQQLREFLAVNEQFMEFKDEGKDAIHYFSNQGGSNTASRISSTIMKLDEIIEEGI
jgi:hypothetical protein